jgi:alpha-beta hydrolase superfamily lysophospholipase
MPDPPDTIVLIHGMWMTPLSWERWIGRYTSRGHRVIARAWPGMEREVEELRRDPSPIARLRAADVVHHYERIVRELERPPIVMGHSIGGTFAQILLDRGLGAAGVGIHPAPPKGILRLPLSMLRTGLSLLGNLVRDHKALRMTAEQFHYAFANTLSEEESAEAYERYCVPAARHVLLEGALTNVDPRSVLRVDYGKRDRAPLLLIAGGKDHTIPASLTRATAKRYGASNASVAYKEFPDRSHYTLGQDGWEEVADYALAWAQSAIGG